MNSTNQIVDKFGRNHDYLRISLTDRCNLRCFYCMPEEGVELAPKESIMSIEEIIDIVKIFQKLGVKKVRYTGGEPLIRKNIEKLFTEVHQLGIEQYITTNAILLDKHIDLLKRCEFRGINISLDTLDKEKSIFITKRDFFDRIMQNIDLMLNEGFNVKINCVLVKGVNDNEILDFVEWTRNKPLSVKFIEFMPFKDNKWDWSKGVGLDEVLNEIQERYPLTKKLVDGENSTSKNYQVEGFKGSFGVISTVTNPFCDTCNRIRLTANGRVKNCLFSDEEVDLLTAFRNGESIENLIKQSILDKKRSRAGMESFEQFSNPELNSENRPMITIGG